MSVAFSFHESSKFTLRTRCSTTTRVRRVLLIDPPSNRFVSDTLSVSSLVRSARHLLDCCLLPFLSAVLPYNPKHCFVLLLLVDNMGGAKCKLTNNTDDEIIVMTFSNADRTYTSYSGLFCIKAGHTEEVSGGLYVAIAYKVFGEKVMWRRWFVKNGGHIYLNTKKGSHMLTSGDGEHKGTGHADIGADTASTIST
jgi:hypothetical protein